MRIRRECEDQEGVWGSHQEGVCGSGGSVRIRRECEDQEGV